MVKKLENQEIVNHLSKLDIIIDEEDKEEYIWVRSLAIKYQVVATTILKWVENGKLRNKMVRKRRYINAKDIQAYYKKITAVKVGKQK